MQAQILNLLHELQQERGLAYLFITHDLSVVRHMADRIVVMYVGKVAEAGPTDAIFDRPEHPYTKALLASSPDVSGETVDLQALEGSIPDPALPPQGCRFHTRCPVATPACGWEVDDVVRWLDESGDALAELNGVTRRSAFDASLGFSTREAAQNLAESLRSDAVPEPMRTALKLCEVADTSVRIAFDEVGEVELTDRGPGHIAACVLEGDHDRPGT